MNNNILFMNDIAGLSVFIKDFLQARCAICTCIYTTTCLLWRRGGCRTGKWREKERIWVCERERGLHNNHNTRS